VLHGPCRPRRGCVGRIRGAGGLARRAAQHGAAACAAAASSGAQRQCGGRVIAAGVICTMAGPPRRARAAARRELSRLWLARPQRGSCARTGDGGRRRRSAKRSRLSSCLILQIKVNDILLSADRRIGLLVACASSFGRLLQRAGLALQHPFRLGLQRRTRHGLRDRLA